MMFEREHVSFGVFSKSNVNRQILETRILYEHPLRVFLTAAPIARGALLKFVSSKRVFGGVWCIKRRFLITLGFNSVFGGVWCIKKRLFIIIAVLDTHHFRSPPEEGQIFCPPFKHQFFKSRPSCHNKITTVGVSFKIATPPQKTPPWQGGWGGLGRAGAGK